MSVNIEENLERIKSLSKEAQSLVVEAESAQGSAEYRLLLDDLWAMFDRVPLLINNRQDLGAIAKKGKR